MRVLLIGSDNPWRMENALERAMQRAGHTTLLIDDRRMKRLMGWKLTQLWARWQANQFAPDFVFLSKCLALDPETVAAIIDGKPNAMWYHDPQWYRDLDRPDIAHIASIGKLARTFHRRSNRAQRSQPRPANCEEESEEGVFTGADEYGVATRREESGTGSRPHARHFQQAAG